MKALSLFAWLLCAGFILNAISGNWALTRPTTAPPASLVTSLAPPSSRWLAPFATPSAAGLYQREYERQGNE